MRVARILGHRIQSIFRSGRAERDLQQELAIHIEQLTREYVDAGMPEPEARLRARRDFGAVASIREQCRDTRRVNFIDDLRKDVAYALRLLRKSPGFTATAVLSLMVGIAANVAIFSLVDAVLIRSLPVRQPHELVEISRIGGGSLSYPMYDRIRNADVFSGAFALTAGRMAASVRVDRTNGGDVHYSPVSGDYFHVLRLSPVAGRFLAEDDLAAANAAVISYDFWQRGAGGDPAVIGKSLRLGRWTSTIVGVAPPGFRGISPGQPVDVWVPLTFGGQPLTNPEALMFRIVGRRSPGASMEQVRARMSVLARQWEADWKLPWTSQYEVSSASGGLTMLRRRFSRPLVVLMTAVGLVLLIAAVNIANLLMARASARQREIGIRLSLGASRGRLIRQLLTESCLLGLIGATFGTALAPATAAFLLQFLSSAVGPVELSFDLNTRMLAFALGVLVSVVLLFGVAPALAATRLDLNALFRGTVAGTGSARSARPRAVLIVAQVAICAVLLTGAILFARSLQSLNNVDAGFRPENVLLLRLQARGDLDGVERIRLYQRVIDRLTAVPGVRAAALTAEQLLGGGTWSEPVSAPGFEPTPGQTRDAVLLVVSPAFFRTMDTPLLRGRDFDARDNERAAAVAIVNEAAAAYYFGGADPLGRTITIEHRSFSTPLTVVGLVRDQKYQSLREMAPRMVYLPAFQVPDAPGDANVAVRTTGSADRMADLLWNEARKESASLSLGGATTQARLVAATIAQDRMLAQLSACFGAAGALLVCLGLYGVTAYDVSRRTAEIAVRMALGAQRSDMIRSVVGGAVSKVSIGIALGLGAAVLLARFVQSLLFGVDGTDLLTLGSTSAILLIIGAAAAYWPARRACAIAPIEALRRE